MVGWLFRISATMGLIGMLSGVAMGITRNFILAPVHAHFILLGFVALFLAALYYRIVPAAAADRLAPIQAGFSVFGAILLPIGVTCVLLLDRATFLPLLAAGWFVVLTGMTLFVLIVYRTTDRAASQA